MTDAANYVFMGRAMSNTAIYFITGVLMVSDDPTRPQSAPMPMDEIRRIYESKTLTDVEVVSALAGHLDRRLSMSRLEGARKLDSNRGREYATIIRLIVERPYPAKPADRPEAIKSVLDDPARWPGVENPDEVRTCLRLAYNLAGGVPADPELLELLDARGTPREITVLVLEAMARSGVPVRALPRLLELAEDPWGEVVANDVGPPKPRRIYPIRERVPDCLRKLGIVVETLDVEDRQVDAQRGRKLTTTVVKVDRESLTRMLRAWILDGRAGVWKPAAEVVHRIPGDDVSNLIGDLLSNEKLPDEERQLLEGPAAKGGGGPGKAKQGK